MPSKSSSAACWSWATFIRQFMSSYGSTVFKLPIFRLQNGKRVSLAEGPLRLSSGLPYNLGDTIKLLHPDTVVHGAAKFFEAVGIRAASLLEVAVEIVNMHQRARACAALGEFPEVDVIGTLGEPVQFSAAVAWEHLRFLRDTFNDVVCISVDPSREELGGRFLLRDLQVSLLIPCENGVFCTPSECYQDNSVLRELCAGIVDLKYVDTTACIGTDAEGRTLWQRFLAMLGVADYLRLYEDGKVSRELELVLVYIRSHDATTVIKMVDDRWAFYASSSELKNHLRYLSVCMPDGQIRRTTETFSSEVFAPDFGDVLPYFPLSLKNPGLTSALGVISVFDASFLKLVLKILAKNKVFALGIWTVAYRRLEQARQNSDAQITGGALEPNEPHYQKANDHLDAIFVPPNHIVRSDLLIWDGDRELAKELDRYNLAEYYPADLKPLFLVSVSDSFKMRDFLRFLQHTNVDPKTDRFRPFEFKANNLPMIAKVYAGIAAVALGVTNDDDLDDMLVLDMALTFRDCIGIHEVLVRGIPAAQSLSKTIKKAPEINPTQTVFNERLTKMYCAAIDYVLKLSSKVLHPHELDFLNDVRKKLRVYSTPRLFVEYGLMSYHVGRLEPFFWHQERRVLVVCAKARDQQPDAINVRALTAVLRITTALDLEAVLSYVNWGQMVQRTGNVAKPTPSDLEFDSVVTPGEVASAQNSSRSTGRGRHENQVSAAAADAPQNSASARTSSGPPPDEGYGPVEEIEPHDSKPEAGGGKRKSDAATERPGGPLENASPAGHSDDSNAEPAADLAPKHDANRALERVQKFVSEFERMSWAEQHKTMQAAALRALDPDHQQSLPRSPPNEETSGLPPDTMNRVFDLENKVQEVVGFQAESFAYQYLQQLSQDGSVRWLSGISVKALEGAAERGASDSLGYDILFDDVGCVWGSVAMTYYVEVKGHMTEHFRGFHLSANEWQTAEQHKASDDNLHAAYVVLGVVLSPEPRIAYKLEDPHALREAGKLRLQPDQYFVTDFLSSIP
eukprot:TRINITY_DN6986_c0_g1_i1.p1 TRINITY_DN6986_c0_g1~~TRINITY_DN6986_c0_g1_i1.p1  ORF type:complete len:1021 (+),score=130.94 TRINITY_DN6986_c0_g1_i1:964-4026(+)